MERGLGNNTTNYTDKMVNNKKKNGTKGAKGTKGASDNGKMGKNKDAKSDLSQLTPDITDLIRNYFPRDAANIEKNWTLFEGNGI